LFLVGYFSPGEARHGKEAAENEPKPAVFIISLAKYADYRGDDMWILQYALDGEVHQAVFQDASRAEKYLAYLEGVGEMKETKEGGHDRAQ
jgi:hypothetical protein